MPDEPKRFSFSYKHQLAGMSTERYPNASKEKKKKIDNGVVI